MDVSGKIIEKYDTQEITETFKIREFVLEYIENPQYSYPELLKFQLVQANCDQLDRFEVGNQIKVEFNLKGRKWTDPEGNVRYFNTLQAWKIERLEDGASSSDSPTPSAPTPPPTEDSGWQKENSSQEQEDDLPF